MIVKNCVLVFLFINLGLTTMTIKEKSEPTISECAAKGGECDESKGRPVCGTDKQTYPTRCHLIRAQCSGHQVSLKHRGPCQECVEARAYAISHRSSSPKYVPRCRADGTYAPVQCKKGSVCWCSDSTGKSIPHTAVRNGKPNCRKNGGKSNTRRSSPRNISNNNNGNKRICTQNDQISFNTNLIKVFHTEYIRYKIPSSGTLEQEQKQLQKQQQDSIPPSSSSSIQLPSSLMSSPDNNNNNNNNNNGNNNLNDDVVLEWKFIMLDANTNQVLDKNEYRELKRLVRKVIKPKRCAKTFGKFCDINHDELLSRTEWKNCLTSDGRSHMTRDNNDSGGTGGGGYSDMGSPFLLNRDHVSSNNNNEMWHEEYEDYSIDEDDEDAGYNSFESTIARNINLSIVHYTPGLLLGHKTMLQSDTESEGESDCITDRKQALEERKKIIQRGEKITDHYMPECTSDGRYKRKQCYPFTGYCWCVNEDTGGYIPGSSAKDKEPDCNSLYPTSRPMNGCPEPKKFEFLKNLKEFLKTKIANNANLDGNTTKWSSEDEKIATLSFVLLDSNKNRVWDKKEWKSFRELVTSSKPLRKCGKRMTRYCDVNNDRKITLSEWLDCSMTQRHIVQKVPETISDTSKPPAQSKLKGANPLETYLKSD